LAACLGHGAWLVFTQNWLFGCLTSRGLLKLVRHSTFLLIVWGPLLLGWLFWEIYPLASGFHLSAAAGWQVPAACYLGFCWIIGLAVLPAVQLGYWLRRRPALLVSNHTEVVDLAAELGYRPIGRGKHRSLARLPGNQLFQVDFAERVFRLPRVPAAWEGLSILHVSDLHLHGTPDRVFFERLMDRCRTWQPDLVALTGDVVDSDEHHRWIIPILGRLCWRVAAFAVLGNHDCWHEPATVRRRLARLGMQVLGNRWVRLEVRGQPLTVIGNEWPWFRPAPDLSACPADGFRLCLSHTPDNFAWAQKHDIDLVLAGHNHGGQIRFPLIGSVFVPSCRGRRYDCGSFYEAPTLLHVSRGLSGRHPVRYGCRPEVTRIVLRCDG
jgi:predicted MPP superfamily phosphohydrolase